MARIVRSNFNGTGAAIYLCLGGIPKSITLWDLEAATPTKLEWDEYMLRDTLTCEGIYLDAAGGATQDMALGEGIQPYWGGDVLTSANYTSYLKEDRRDFRQLTNNGAGILGDAATADIETWTLDTVATALGHFNSNINGTYCGDGSPIVIEVAGGKQYETVVTTCGAAAGSTANDVKLAYPVPTGKVRYLGRMYTFGAYYAVGDVTSAGVKINNTTLMVSGHIIGFRADFD